MDKINYIEIIHKGRKVKTLVGNTKYEDLILNKSRNVKIKYTVQPEHEHRPDLISYKIFNDVDYWGYMLEIGGIFDPFEGISSGDTIIV